MARYDRLASLPVPGRGTSYPGFGALTDLADREREAELARRTRLHYLALRPLLRWIRAGATINAASLAQQVEDVRAELATLSGRDPQRHALSELLTGLCEPRPDAVVGSALALADCAIVWGHLGAADEYACAAAELARSAGLVLLEAEALAARGRCAAAAGRPQEGVALAARAAALALEAGDRQRWARAIAEEAAYLRAAGDGKRADERLVSVEAAGAKAGDSVVISIGAEAAARMALAAGSAGEAAEHAWRGLSHATSLERRVRLVELLGDAFAALGHSDAADHAYRLAATSAAEAPERLRLTARRARSRAERGDGEGYRTLSRSVPGVVMTAAARLELARGALAIGDLETAKRHVIAAQQSARSQLQREAGRAAATLAAAIESGEGGVVAVRVHTGSFAAAAARIAERVLSVGTLDAQH
jgi:tetratricopeptide (TPR) repeat protein